MARKALRTAFFFTQSAATRFTASIFLFLNRVFPRRAFGGLEPYMAKVLSTVLRGLDPSNGVRLLGRQSGEVTDRSGTLGQCILHSLEWHRNREATVHLLASRR